MAENKTPKQNKIKNAPVDNTVRHVACFVPGTLAHGSSVVHIRESHKASRAPAKWLASFLTSPEQARWPQRGEAELSKLLLSVKDCAIRLTKKKERNEGGGGGDWINTSGTQAGQ